MSEWSLEDLERWDERIQVKVAKYGLDCYPLEFEVCDQNAMLGYMAYHGMPSHYPHWSYGKAYEQQKTMYDYGVTGLPYELVINSDPCLAYLMRDNSLCLQILTIAHVYGHNDFFKNNFTFTSATRASETIASFKTRADRIRRYMKDPSIGADAVERFLDAAHALAFNRTRNMAIKKLDAEGQRERLRDLAEPRRDPFAAIHKAAVHNPPDLSCFPLEPDQDILLFVRDNNNNLAAWQRDILTIVDEETCYFLPQIDTKIMNEGWASFWHHKLMNAIDLPPEIHMEFLVRHNQVVCPHPGGLNPYHVGFVIWSALEKRFGGVESKDCVANLMQIREAERDVSFLRRFLTPELMHELDLFAYRPQGEHLVVTEVSDKDDWEHVKNQLLAQIGSNSFPVIKIVDANSEGKGILHLIHKHDGRDLDVTSAIKTLVHLETLWGRDVSLLTCIGASKKKIKVHRGHSEVKNA